MAPYSVYIDRMRVIMKPTAIWWFIVAIFVVVVGFVVGQSIFMLIMGAILFESAAAVSDASIKGSVFGLLPFIAPIMVVALALRIFHKTRLWVLFQPAAQFRQDFGKALIGILPVALIYAALSYFTTTDVEVNISIGMWLLLLPLGLLLVLLQTGSEEVVFRGYFQGQLAAMDMPTWVWIGVPSLIFGLMHYDPSNSVTEGVIYVIFATCFGLFVADLTARTGTLAAAIVFHAVNNSMSMIFLAKKGFIDGFTLFVMPNTNVPLGAQDLFFDVVTISALYAGIRYGFRNKKQK